MAKSPSDPEQLTRRWMRRFKVPGAVVGIVERGRRPILRGYGYRNREARLPATPRTMFGLASVTKSFTAMAILRLAEDGRLSVRDPIVRHLPEFATPERRASRRITIHHFLTHTSGLPPLPSIYYTTIRSTRDDPPYDPAVARKVGIDPEHVPIDTYEQILDYLRTTRYRLLGAPGRFFSYSNEGFGLLGAVIERVTGRTYESYVEEAVLRPAGMRSTSFDPGILFRQPEVTILYSPRRAGRRHGLVPSETWWGETCLRAAGGLRSNVDDLSRYLEIYLHAGKVDGERVLRPSSVAQMMRPYAGLEGGVSYGYGVEVRPDYHGTPLVFHSGGLPGVSSLFAVAPKRGVAAVILTNVEGGSVAVPLLAALNGRLGLPLRSSLFEPPEETTPPKSLAEYDGWFCSGEGIWVRSTDRGDHLRFDFRGIELTFRGLRFRPAGRDRFVTRIGGQTGQVRFERDARGRVWALFLGHRLLRRRSPADLRRARRGRLEW